MSSELIHFVESPGFTNRLDKLASLDVLFSMQNELVKNPELGDLMAGCAGARKGRVGDKALGKGKSGGFDTFILHRDRGNNLFAPFLR